ncbi:hypothetical protein MAPG_06935 [Magnaporthiopsis poae ATCC 64411]|uniref:Uncharacterized protein n=1 Tax=Magnaporthiopsis poae (strain ATCC 64411 / 73-15) TaxID=644358 RepID=A0A0C4E3D6_MAGP6|nr:hypothetical protein MAPG_06935 [Magnaporthiopsis poae ATCC 64411]
MYVPWKLDDYLAIVSRREWGTRQGLQMPWRLSDTNRSGKASYRRLAGACTATLGIRPDNRQAAGQAGLARYQADSCCSSAIFPRQPPLSRLALARLRIASAEAPFSSEQRRARASGSLGRLPACSRAAQWHISSYHDHGSLADELRYQHILSCCRGHVLQVAELHHYPSSLQPASPVAVPP